mgnify:CR=1 FL=1
MDKHTPGPWTKAERLNGPWWHISADASGLGPGQGRQAVAAVHGESKRGATAYAEMFDANAQLIAAAPELLEALRCALMVMRGEALPRRCDAIAAAEAALVKAIGVRFNAIYRDKTCSITSPD